jgi:hypothetical protein
LSIAKRLALITVGYALSVAGGLAAVTANEAFMPTEIAQTSGGMVAFGDMVLFVLVGGFLCLVPTWFLLNLAIEQAPRTLLATLLMMAAIGPVSWLTTLYLTGGPGATKLPHAVLVLSGPFIAFAAVPRMIFGPVLLAIEGVAFRLARQHLTRVLLAASMLMDVVPLCLFALHLARAAHY